MFHAISLLYVCVSGYENFGYDQHAHRVSASKIQIREQITK